MTMTMLEQEQSKPCPSDRSRPVSLLSPLIGGALVLTFSFHCFSSSPWTLFSAARGKSPTDIDIRRGFAFPLRRIKRKPTDLVAALQLTSLAVRSTSLRINKTNETANERTNERTNALV
jgi:hypothetical protein